MMQRQAFFTKNVSKCLAMFSSIVWGATELLALQRLRYRAWRAQI